MSNITKLLFLASFSLLLNIKPAFACLSCGCGTSGSSSDLGSIGGASAIFAKDKKFLLQIGSSYRDINGSFNELGKWYDKPSESMLSSLQSTLGLMYFPVRNFSIGVQLPLMVNFLSKAAYGSFGSIAPTDLNFTSGASLGDISTQLTYKVYEENNFALIPWFKADLPTGQSVGNPENLSGSGVLRLNGGVLGIKTIDKFEFLLNLGYQHPFGVPVSFNTNFYPGNALIGQVNGNYQIFGNLKAGLGISGFAGKLLYSNNSMPTFKIKFTASLQHDLSMYHGIGISAGYEPRFLGANTTTDTNLNIVFYQFF